MSLPFAPSPKARSSLRAGTVYAIDGGDSYIYYGQVAADKSVGFFKCRSKRLSSVEVVTSNPLMSRFGVIYPSIGVAVRAGTWLNLGRHALREELTESPQWVQWPVGTLEVSIWKRGKLVKNSKIHDPEIQNLEIMAAYDAVYDVPPRLRADFVAGLDTWPVGGPVWRERIKKEEAAARYPGQHALPADWVHVDREQSRR